MPTGFFDLPRELRDRIYSLAWDKHLPEPQAPSPSTLNNQYASHSTEIEWSQPGQPPIWTMTCKRMLDEAVDEFYRKHFVRLRLRHWPVGNTSFNLDYILSPCRAREVYLHVHAMGTTAWSQGSSNTLIQQRPTYYLRHLHSRHESWVPGFLDKVDQLGKIRVLKIIIELDCGHSDLRQSFDLKPLRSVGLFANNLDVYEIYFDILKYPHTADQNKALHAIRNSVLMEVDYMRKNWLQGMAFKMEAGWVPIEDGTLLRWALRFKRT